MISVKKPLAGFIIAHSLNESDLVQTYKTSRNADFEDMWVHLFDLTREEWALGVDPHFNLDEIKKNYKHEYFETALDSTINFLDEYPAFMKTIDSRWYESKRKLFKKDGIWNVPDINIDMYIDEFKDETRLEFIKKYMKALKKKVQEQYWRWETLIE